MKRVLSLFLAVLLCLCLAACNGSAIPEIYKKSAQTFVEGIGSMSVNEVRTFAENNGWDFEFYTFNSYKISNGDKWESVIKFDSNTISEVEFNDWDSYRTIDISSTNIIYMCMPPKKTMVFEKFNTLGDCEKYVFGEKSGINFTVKKEVPSSSSSSSNSSSSSSLSISLRYGKLLDKKITGTSLIIKAKIEPSYNNKATVDQNYYNIENIVKNQGGSKFKEIQYWAVADMTDGSEQKVISFTVPEDVIQKIANDKIVANQIGNYVDDLFIHASLR